MEYYKKVIIKDGKECLLRNPTAKDADAILEHMKQTSYETDNMLRYSDEIVMTKSQESDYLNQIENSADAVMVAAIVDGKLVANGGFNPIAAVERCRHRATFGISIKKEYWGLGIGSAIIEAVIESARQAGYEQLELDVIASNKRAIALYQKFGFKRYGVLEHGFYYRDGHYEDLYLMMCKL